MKFTEQEIINAVKNVIEDHQTIGRAARAAGMSTTQLRNYVGKVREHGYASIKIRRKKRYHSGSFKVQVIEYLREHKLSCYATAVHFNLTKSLVQIWERRCLEEGTDSLYEDRRGRRMNLEKRHGRRPKMTKQVEEDLIAENQRLRMENEFLKKLNALVQDRIKHEHKK
jgi:transposase